MANWLTDEFQPTKNYYIEIMGGRRGESDSALELFDLMCEPGYSESEARVTQVIMSTLLLRQVAMQLAQEGKKADVYDGLGIIFSNYKNQEGDLDFIDEEPIILDAWNEITTIKSLIDINYITLYQKVPTFAADKEFTCVNCMFFDDEKSYCSTWDAENCLERMEYCPFFTKNERFLDYKLVGDFETDLNGFIPPQNRKN